jgi:hypothetical protein
VIAASHDDAGCHQGDDFYIAHRTPLHAAGEDTIEDMTHPHVTYLGPAYPDATDPTAMRELHSRVSDGIQVDLLWSERKGQTWVAVKDSKRGESFSVLVREGERPLDVFHHPYAYAASRGVDTGATSEETSNAQAITAN